MLMNKNKLFRASVAVTVALTTFFSVSAKEFEARYWFDYDLGNCHYCTVSSGSGELAIPLDKLNAKAIHQISFQVKNADGEWSSVHTQLFTLKQKVSKNLNLIVESPIGNFKKNLSFSADSKEVSVDVSGIRSGIFLVKAMLLNESDSQPLAVHSSLVDGSPTGSDKITSIYYWLDDSVAVKKEILIANGSYPFKYEGELNLSELNIPTHDYALSIKDGKPQATPSYNLGAGILSNRGFMVDSASYFSDKSKTSSINPVTLEANKQYDFGHIKPEDNLWTQFTAQEGDEVRLIPRWKSSARIFDASGLSLDTLALDDVKVDATFKAETSGVLYAQVFALEESRRDYSVKMLYVDGPSTEFPINSEQEYEGVLVDWDSYTQWQQSEEGINLKKGGINMSVVQSVSSFVPEVTERTNICKALHSNKIHFSADKYIEKITMCVLPGTVIPQISTSEGSVSIDRETSIVVWEGLSNNVDLIVNNYPASLLTDDLSIPELLLEKAYVKLSEIDASVFEEETLGVSSEFEDFDYVGYNCMRIWEHGSKVGEYQLSDKISISFNDNKLCVKDNGVNNVYDIKDCLIITYSTELLNDPGEDDNGVSSTSIDRPSVEIDGDNLRFRGLPNYIAIYSLDGKEIFNRCVEENEFLYPSRNLGTGIFIIKIGDYSIKMLIK